jgi:hypothetical protein
VKRTYFYGEIIVLVAEPVKSMLPPGKHGNCILTFLPGDEIPASVRDLAVPDAFGGQQVTFASVDVGWFASIKKGWTSETGVEVVATFRLATEVLERSLTDDDVPAWVTYENKKGFAKAIKKLRGGSEMGHRKGDPKRQKAWIKAGLSNVFLGLEPG